MSVPEEIAALVFDRTQEDVDKVKEYKRRMMTGGLSALTEDEMTEYMAGMKGCYNYQDLNRVGAAVNVVLAYLVARDNAIDNVRSGAGLADDIVFHICDQSMLTDVSGKTDWVMTDIPNSTTMGQYIGNVLALYRSMTKLPDGIPSPPANGSKLTWQVANNIEKVLLMIYEFIDTRYSEIYQMISQAKNSKVFSGEIDSGDYYSGVTA